MGRVDFFRGAVVLCLIVASTPVLVCAASNPEVSLSGTVFADGTYQRLAHAVVAICDDAGHSLEQVTTDGSGEFTFHGLRPAHYILTVQAAGFQMAEVPVELSLAAERGLTVVLKPAARATKPLAAGERTISAHELSMPEEARELVASGKKKLYLGKNATGAVADFQSAIGKAPEYYEAYFEEGVAYLSLQDPASAEKLFRKSVEMSDEKYAEADMALGALLLEHHQLPEGESLLRLGLASSPFSWPGQFELGKLELSRDHLPAALAAAETAQAVAPRQAVIYRLLTAIHLRQQNYPAVVRDIDLYLELDSDSPAATRARELRAQAQQRLASSPGTAVAVK